MGVRFWARLRMTVFSARNVAAKKNFRSVQEKCEFDLGYVISSTGCDQPACPCVRGAVGLL
jgi:hypothetical protein